MADSYVFLDASNIEVLIHHDNGSTTTFPRWESESDNLYSDRWKQMREYERTLTILHARPWIARCQLNRSAGSSVRTYGCHAAL